MTPTEQGKTMVRRVAEAIRDVLLAQGGFEESRDFVLWDGEAHVDCLESARAAIGAMREPTDHITQAWKEESYGYIPPRSMPPEEAWRIGMAAALSEEGE